MTRFPILALAFLCCSAAPRATEIARYDARGPTAGYVYGNTVDVGTVDELSMADTYIQFSELAFKGAKEVTLRIDSFGGSIFLGNRVIRELEDLKKRHGMTVTCIVDGSAYSMGAVILQSPLCDRRLATARSTILFHNGSSGVRGTAEDLREAATFLEALNESMALVVSARLGISLEEYRSRIAHADWIMAVPQALGFNVIDGVVSPSDIAPPAGA